VDIPSAHDVEVSVHHERMDIYSTLITTLSETFDAGSKPSQAHISWTNAVSIFFCTYAVYQQCVESTETKSSFPELDGYSIGVSQHRLITQIEDKDTVHTLNAIRRCIVVEDLSIRVQLKKLKHQLSYRHQGTSSLLERVQSHSK
jgi:hypothetical protein